MPEVLRGLIQDTASELPRILIPRTSVNMGRKRSKAAYEALVSPQYSCPSAHALSRSTSSKK
jgi:hypothetical protein